MFGPKSTQRYSRHVAHEPGGGVPASAGPAYRLQGALDVQKMNCIRRKQVVARYVLFAYSLAGRALLGARLRPYTLTGMRRAAPWVHYADAGGVPSCDGRTLHADGAQMARRVEIQTAATSHMGLIGEFWKYRDDYESE
ncbi:hypothetical protein PENSPDRAFT_48784 [Peniophora sp. CONT]|nr:hypothetical protein PENSPDRAFT_48784 [Peniophora sp. CONT]